MNYAFIALANLSLLALSIIDNGRGPAYPDMLSYFGIPTSTGSWIFSLVTITGLLTFLLSKFWLPKLGAIKSSRAGLIILGISSFGLALAGETKSLSILMIASALMGPGVAACSATVNILVISGTTPKVRRRYLSALHAVYGLSSFLAPLALSLFIKFGLNWQRFFIAAGVIPLAIVALSFLQKAKDNTISEAWTNPAMKVKRIERVILGIVFGCYVSSEIAISTRLPLYLQEIHQLDAIAAANGLSAFFFCLMSGRLLFALINFPFPNTYLLFSSLITSLFVFFVGVFYSPSVLPIIGFTMGPFFPTAMDLLSKRYGKQSDFMATSVLTSIGLTMSIMHIVFGQIGDRYGVSTAFYLVPFFTTLSLTALIFFQVKLPAENAV